MVEKQKKVRKYNVGKSSSKTMRTASLDTITGLYERFCKLQADRRNVTTHTERLSSHISII